MKALYFDCSSGISGEKALGVLLDLGADNCDLRRELSKLGLETEYELIVKKTTLGGITGTEVKIERKAQMGRFRRSLKDVLGMVEDSELAFRVKEISARTFREIAHAKAKINNVPIDRLYLNEVFVIESIIYIVGCAICIDLLGVERIYSSPLHDGRGFVKCGDCIVAIPMPAVAEMLRDTHIPFVREDVEKVLVTPVGMGLIKTITSYFGNMPAIIIDRVGYGISRNGAEGFELLKAVIGEQFGERDALEEFAMIETENLSKSGAGLNYPICSGKGGS
jgi:uncharacterized protein (DUF111 family)